MKANNSKLILSLLIILSFLGSVSVYGQEKSEGNFTQDSLRDIYTVGFSMVGGAVLGLSTLSFVDKPSEHFKNVLVGASLGIIVGVGLVAYLQASKTEKRFENVFTGYQNALPTINHEISGLKSKNYQNLNSLSPFFLSYQIPF